MNNCGISSGIFAVIHQEFLWHFIQRVW